MKVEITQKLIDELISVSRKAGEQIMEIYESEDFAVEHKSDESPLTRADKASNKVICDHLAILTPDTPVISEENSIPPYEVRKEYSSFWLIDPLDGTKEFIKRNGDFTTNIALIVNGRVVLGVVYAPVLNTLYWAAAGMGAHKIADDKSRVISARAFKKDAKALVVTCSRSHLNEDTKNYIAQFDDPKLMQVGSSLKLMLVAEGSADIYPRLGPISEWDIAASHIIVEEAGGRVYKYADGSDVIYNKENILMPYFIAEGKSL